MKNLNLKKLYSQGVKKLQETRAQDELKKRGNLRAGNTGVVDEKGVPHGACPRVAWLRSEGHEIPPADDKLLMFTTGFANEDDWMEKLGQSWHGSILQEEEIPTEWFTDSGYKVTGRPDIVLCGSDHQPKAVLELKSIQSFWTIRDIALKNSPRIAHLAQAAHYMWQLGTEEQHLPGYLIYTSQTNRMIPWKYKEEFKGTRFEDERGMNVIPFHYQYDLDMRDGMLYYKGEGADAEWTPTIITQDRIKRFYEVVGEMAQTKKLAPRPSANDATGGKKYAPCQYCPFSSVCDSYEDQEFDTWLDHIILACP